MEELEKGLKELRVLQLHGKSNIVNSPNPPEFPGDWTTSQRVHMVELMAPAAYVAEDGLVRHQ